MGLPIDIGVQPNGQQHFATRRFANDDLAAIHAEWHAHLRGALDRLPNPWGDLIAAEAHR